MKMLLWVLSGLLWGACVPAAGQALTQGIQGTVLLRTGNHMPGPGKSVPPAQAPAIREIRVYFLTHVSQVKTIGSFYSQIQTKLVAKVVSGRDGTFRLFLPPGKYSLLSQETQGLFANRRDGENNIFPVEVKAGQVTPVEFIIDYNASY
jgi:hypothetical protein